MRHLGVLKGSGLLESSERQLGRADYEFDGYLIPPAQVVGSGEVRMAADALSEAFGRKDLRLHTDGGRRLSIRFSGKGLAPGANIAHADVGEGLPPAQHWRR